MTPQSNFMVAAPVAPGREDALRALLATMNLAPGVVDPDNALVPFARFDRLHVARFVILHDETLGDLTQYGVTFPDAPVWLVFLGDCDGTTDAMLAELVARAGAGLTQIFAHCDGFDAGDLLAWMRAHSATPAAQYINWVGRTVQQIREEAALHTALSEQCARDAATFAGKSPEDIRQMLAASVRQNGPPLTPPAATPAAWLAGHIGNLIGVPLALLLAGSVPVALRAVLSVDSCASAKPPMRSSRHARRRRMCRELSVLEDHDVTNQFTAFGSVKPGCFRLSTLVFVFWVLNFSTRQIYTRGRLARVGTIHFARWVFMDNHRRLLFCSNYDGSLDSYMDDFINKVAYGLNLVFSNGIGYPRTNFLLCGGANDEQTFKYYLRRHQVPTQVWYKAYPGLTAADLARNTADPRRARAPAR